MPAVERQVPSSDPEAPPRLPGEPGYGQGTPLERGWIERLDPLFCSCDYDFSLDNLLNSLPALGPAGGVVGEAGAIIGSLRWAATARAGVKFDPSKIGHIFREAPGHVNPASAASQARFARLFESAASNPANLRADAVRAGLITQEAADAGVRAFTQMTGSGRQVWVTVRDGVIQNAGVNRVGTIR